MIVVLASASPSGALTDEDVYGALRIRFIAPGGRVASMGGAGLALVDDAAASRLNPARLAAISFPETVVEGQVSSYPTTSTGSGRIQFDPSTNPFAGATFGTTTRADAATSPGFLSFAYPLALHQRPLVVAVSRTEALNLSLDARSVHRTTPLPAPVAPSAGDEVLRISHGSLDADLELYDIAAGWRLTPTFSVGASLVAARLRLSSETVGLLADPLQFTVPGTFDPRSSGPAAVPLAITETDGSDTDFAYSFGAWWKPHHALSVATVYRRGARFGIPATSRDLSAGTRDSFSNVVKQPDTEAVGAAWTPFDHSPSAALQSLTFAFDLERTEYSDQLDGLRTGENVLTRPGFVRRISYTAADATDARLGVEYRRSFLTWTLALRGGLSTEHDGGLHLDDVSGDLGALQGQSRAMKDGDFFRGRENGLHETFGAGVRFYSLSIDVAFDISEPVDRMAASITYHLPGQK